MCCSGQRKSNSRTLFSLLDRPGGPEPQLVPLLTSSEFGSCITCCTQNLCGTSLKLKGLNGSKSLQARSKIQWRAWSNSRGAFYTSRFMDLVPR